MEQTTFVWFSLSTVIIGGLLIVAALLAVFRP
jgi:hypothetical protein